jgi:hypothetical protein
MTMLGDGMAMLGDGMTMSGVLIQILIQAV